MSCCYRLRRSGLLTLFALVFSIYLALRAPTCADPENLHGSRSNREAEVQTATRSASRSFGSSPSPSASRDPSGLPVTAICDLPLDVMAPTTRASHTAYPSLDPAPSYSSVDEAVLAERVAASRRSTAQCGMVVSDNLGNPAARLTFCKDFSAAIEKGARKERDGPFFTQGCRAMWFTPSEACDLLSALDKRILFVGDSISRQLQQGIFSVLTGS
jgi:hypothetical protein